MVSLTTIAMSTHIFPIKLGSPTPYECCFSVILPRGRTFCDTLYIRLVFFPGKTSSMRKKTLNFKDLFVEPNFDEMKSIAMDSKGDLKKLTHAQLESVRRTGEFEVSTSF